MQSVLPEAEQKKMQHQLINLFRHADQSIKRVIRKKLEGTGVYRSQHRLLMILGSHPDSSQTELAEKMDISPAAVAVTLKKLERGGYISRQCLAEDNRMNHVGMTEKGQEAIDKSIICFREIEEAVFQGFSQEEMELFYRFFQRVIENGESYYRELLRREKEAQKER